MYFESPAWLAAMVQVPAATPETVLPATVQMVGVVELNATARPEVAVALAVVVPPTLRVAGVKLIAPIVWLARLAVVLFDVEGFGHAEIGRILGVPEGTVRSDVFHARRFLRSRLAGWKEER